MEFSLVSKSTILSSSTGPGQNFVITTDADWDNFITVLGADENLISSFTETDIDYTTYQAIAMIDIARPDTGYRITIDSIAEFQNEIKVYSTAGPGLSGGFLSFAKPYHIVKIPASDKPVVFE